MVISFSLFLVSFFRIFVALLLGSILGIERTFAGKTAGMRTYGLVAMGSCLFIVVSNLVSLSFIDIASFDPMRVPAGIITGIGFLGAGIIFFRENEPKISGLTTAAGLWVACGIGIAIGFGFYEIATFTAILTFLSFTFLWKIEMLLKSNFNPRKENND
ncbi:MAG: MgtC/SapB family protein [Candidatus Paceibacterota bacterium]